MVPIQLWATPIWGRDRSSSVNPTAFIMARAGARSGPSRRTRLFERGSAAMVDSFGRPWMGLRAVRYRALAGEDSTAALGAGPARTRVGEAARSGGAAPRRGARR